MTNVIDNAVARIQDIVDAMTSVTFKSFPDYPIENVDPFPMSVVYMGSGLAQFGTADTLYVFPSINVEFHFSRVNLKQAQQQINATAIEFSQRLAGDPTLAGLVSTIQSGSDNPISFRQQPFVWNQNVTSQMLVFIIPFKTMQTPTATA